MEKETDSETLIQETDNSGSIEIPDMPETENLRIGPQLEEQLTELLRETEEITERRNISTDINLSQKILWECYSSVMFINGSQWLRK